MIEKGIARTITFTMRDSTTGQPKTTINAGDVTVKISKDGGAFAATTNTPVAIQDTSVNTGEFALTLTSTEMTADAIVIKGTATGCIEVRLKIATEANYTATRAGYLTGAVALDSTVAKEATTIAASGNIITEINQIPTTPLLTNDSRLAYLDRAISLTLPASGYIAPDNTTINNIYNEVATHPTLLEIEASSILAKEDTVLTRAASGEYSSTIADIKIQTDKLLFDTNNFVKSNPQTTITASISTSDMDTIVDKVWDDARTEHTSGGTMGAGIPAATMGRV